MKTNKVTALAVMVGSLCLAGVASASSVNATYTGISPGAGVRVSLAGASFTSTTGGVFNFTRNSGDAPQLLGPGAANTFVGFCLELNEYISGPAGDTHDFTLTDLDDAPIDAGGTISGGMGTDKADAIRYLLGGNLPSFTAAGSLSASNALALQIAIWEIVHETDSSFNLASGNARFQSTGSDNSNLAFSTATTWLGLLNTNGHTWTMASGLVGLTKDGVQDYVGQVVPIPAAAWLLGSGLLGLFGLARRKKIAAAA